MGDSFLERERVFLDMNEELEERSNDMWQEIESVMNVQETHSNSVVIRNPVFCNQHPFSRWPFDRESRSTRESSFHRYAEQYFKELQPREFQETFSPEKASSHNSSSDGSWILRSQINEEKQSEDIDGIDDFIPLEGKQMSSQSKLRFLTAKTKVLHEECLSLHDTLKKEREESVQLRKALQKAEEEKLLWHQSSKQYEDTAKKNIVLLEEANRRCLKKGAENSAIQKNMDKLNHDLKISLQKNGSYETRLNRVMLENQMLKAALKTAKVEEKEKASETKKKCEKFIGAVQKLEKQKNELIVAFKKQLQLTDNLKRQRILSDVNTRLEDTENNFVQLLEWNPNPEMTGN